MVETKSSHHPVGNESKNLTDENKGQSSTTKQYRGKKTRTKNQVPELEAKTNFKGWCRDLQGYIFDLGLRYPDKFARKRKEMTRYIGENYRNSCQPSIMTKTLSTLPHPEMPEIIPGMGVERPKTDTNMAYPKKNCIGK